MRLILIIIPLLFLLSGCGTVQKTYKSVGHVTHFQGKDLGNGFVYYDAQSLIKLFNTLPNYDGLVQDILKVKIFRQDLMNAGFSKQTDNGYVLSKLEELKYNVHATNPDIELKITSFGHSQTRNEYILAGRIDTKSHYNYNGKASTANYYHNFLAIYDSDGNLTGIYYNKFSDFLGDSMVASNGIAAWIKCFDDSYIINLDSKITAKLPQTKYIKYEFNKWKFSDNGNFFALETQDTAAGEKGKGLLLFDVLNNQVLLNSSWKLEHGHEVINFEFAQNDRYFVYKIPNDPILIYDLQTKQINHYFGNDQTPNRNRTQIQIKDQFVLANITGYDKANDEILKTQGYLYDLSNKELFCTFDMIPFENIDIYNNTLQVYDYIGRLDIYNLEKNNCFKLGSYQFDFIFKYEDRHFRYIENDVAYIFKDGKIKSHTMNKINYTQENIEAIKKLHKADQLIKAGFEQKGLEVLKDLILNDSYDYYTNAYNWIGDTFKYNSNIRALIDVMAFKRYVNTNQTDESFDKAIRRYIFTLSRVGHKDLIPNAINAYKRALPMQITKHQQEMLKIFEATYLLDIGKDQEAYDLLIDSMPLSKKTVETIQLYSDWNMGITKDTKKLAFVLGIQESNLKKVEEKWKPREEFYNLDGVLVKKDAMPTYQNEVNEDIKPSVVSPTNDTKSNDALMLLD